MLEATGTSRRLISTRWGHVHVRSNGEGDPPLVLLHMGLSSGRMYRHITPRLAAGRRVVVPDRLGFGCSDHPRPGLSPGDAFDELDIPWSHNVNSTVMERYPDIVAKIVERGDEIIAHGRTNSERSDCLWEDDEARLIAETTEVIEQHWGRRPSGWPGPYIIIPRQSSPR